MKTDEAPASTAAVAVVLPARVHSNPYIGTGELPVLARASFHHNTQPP